MMELPHGSTTHFSWVSFNKLFTDNVSMWYDGVTSTLEDALEQMRVHQLISWQSASISILTGIFFSVLTLPAQRVHVDEGKEIMSVTYMRTFDDHMIFAVLNPLTHSSRHRFTFNIFLIETENEANIKELDRQNLIEQFYDVLAEEHRISFDFYRSVNITHLYISRKSDLKPLAMRIISKITEVIPSKTRSSVRKMDILNGESNVRKAVYDHEFDINTNLSVAQISQCIKQAIFYGKNYAFSQNSKFSEEDILLFIASFCHTSPSVKTNMTIENSTISKVHIYENVTDKMNTFVVEFGKVTNEKYLILWQMEHNISVSIHKEKITQDKFINDSKRVTLHDLHYENTSLNYLLTRRKRSVYSNMKCSLFKNKKENEVSDDTQSKYKGRHYNKLYRSMGRLGDFPLMFVKVDAMVGNCLDQFVKSNPKLMGRLKYAHKISMRFLYFQMGMPIVAHLVDSNWAGLAFSLAFITYTMGIGKVAEHLMMHMPSPVTRLKFSGILSRFTVPLLARLPMIFVFVDLAQRVKRDTWDAENVATVISAAFDLTLEIIQYGLQVSRLFGSATAAALTDMLIPIVDIVILVIFVGIQLFHAIRVVDQMNSVLEMTKTERFIEGVKAFIGSQSITDYQVMLERKQVNNHLSSQIRKYLIKNENFQYYFKSGERLEEELVEQTILEPQDYRYELAVAQEYVKPVRQNFTKYNAILIENNYLNLFENNTRYIRAMPDLLHDEALVCSEYDKQLMDLQKEVNMYECRGMMGLQNKTRTKGKVLIEAGLGCDIIIAFQDVENIVTFSNGLKYAEGSRKNDIFFLKVTETIHGVIKAHEGHDILIFDSYESSSDILQVLPVNEYGVEVKFSKDPDGLLALNFEHFIGRLNKKDIFEINCEFKIIDLLGGLSVEDKDEIHIPQLNDCFRSEIILSCHNNTLIKNMAPTGSFFYDFNSSDITNVVITLAPNIKSNHTLRFFYDIENVERMELQDSQFSMTTAGQHQIKIDNFLSQIQLHFLPNNATITMYEGGETIVVLTKQQSIAEFILRGKMLGIKLGAHVMSFVESEETHVTIGYTAKDVNKTNLNLISNTPQNRTYIIAAQYNLFQIDCNLDQSFICTFKEVIIDLADNSHSELTIDDIFSKVRKSSKQSVKIDLLYKQDVHINLYMSKSLVLIGNIVMKNLKLANNSIQLRTDDDVFDVVYDMTNNTYRLDPRPFVATGNVHSIFLTSKDAQVIERDKYLPENTQWVFAVYKIVGVEMLATCNEVNEAHCLNDHYVFADFLSNMGAFKSSKLVYTNANVMVLHEFEEFQKRNNLIIQ